MHLITLAALLSGVAASVIPTAANPFSIVVPLERRQVVAPTETCGSYTTVTVTPAVVSVTSSELVTTTAETITTTEVSITESAQETTEVVTVTEFETSFTTETTTAATVTETEVVNQRKKKRGCGYKQSRAIRLRRPLILNLVVCIGYIIFCIDFLILWIGFLVLRFTDALFTTTTETITGSATATATEIVTSLIIETTTTTVSTTDVITTIVPTTVPVTATTVVTSTVAPATPTVILKAVGGSVDGKYLTLLTASSAFEFIAFTSDVTSAKSFYIADNGALAPTSYTDRLGYYSNGVGSASYVLVTTASYATSQGGVALSCQLNGSATAGSTGSLTCPNGGSALATFSIVQGRLNVQNSQGTNEVITLEYTVLS
ncbi:hypothetical protein TruAng_005431 [Truncatella angustata]|nr:hypothetical protein TruAng_005431 [Truncatella angustata]